MTSAERTAAYRARRKARFFDGAVCAHCGTPENLEIDHIDPGRKAQGHRA